MERSSYAVCAISFRRMNKIRSTHYFALVSSPIDTVCVTLSYDVVCSSMSQEDYVPYLLLYVC